MSGVVLLVCGEQLRGDDAVAPLAVAGLPDAMRREVDIRSCPAVAVEDLLALGRDDHVVIVDAVTGPRPGSVVRASLDELGRMAATWSALSGHQLPLAETIAIAQVLGWEGRGTFVGVAAQSFGLGEPLSEPVRLAVPALRRAIRDIVRDVSAAPSVVADEQPVGVSGAPA